MALSVHPLFHPVEAAALERCITRHHIPYLRGLTRSQLAMAALEGHRVALPKMVHLVYSDLLALMEEVVAAMVVVWLQIPVEETAARAAVLNAKLAPEVYQ